MSGAVQEERAMTENEGRAQEYFCESCQRRFIATPEDVNQALGHLCIAMDQGLTQSAGLAAITEAGQ